MKPSAYPVRFLSKNGAFDPRGLRKSWPPSRSSSVDVVRAISMNEAVKLSSRRFFEEMPMLRRPVETDFVT